MSSTYVDSKYHIIIRTRDEEPLLTVHLRDELYRYIHGIVRNHDSQALRIGGMAADHLRAGEETTPGFQAGRSV